MTEDAWMGGSPGVNRDDALSGNGGVYGDEALTVCMCAGMYCDVLMTSAARDR